MIWKPRNIPTYNSETKRWSYTYFESRKEFSEYVDSMWKLPGEYNLKNTYLWRPHAIKFQKTGKYTDFEEDSVGYKQFFKTEREKIAQGVIIDDHYLPPEYYWFLNFTPIVDKIKGNIDFAEVWDSDYHWYLYMMRARLRNLNGVTIKARQKGLSVKHTSRLGRNLWFIDNSVNKMIAYEDDYVNEKGSWKFLVGYRDFLNSHTGWYRDFEPDESGNWEQKKSYVEGTYQTKKKSKGKRSKLISATAKKNPTKAVGGGIYEMFCEEAGIFPNLDKVIEFAEAATKMGGVKTGFVSVSGSVGELKDCKPLETFCLNPEQYGFFGVEDTFSEIPLKSKIGFFWPDYWNYLADVDGEIVKCYDEDGNSDIEKAKYYLGKVDLEMQGKESYTLWKSQHPFTIQDAFAIREDNIWPTRIIKEHQTFIKQVYKPLCVDLIPDPDEPSRITHKLSTWSPVNTLNVDPKQNNRGVVEIDEMPSDNPKWGLYYAGVDPIRSTNTVTSKSLMSVTIWKSAHTKGGKIYSEYPVARYTGRHYNWEDTYDTCMNLIRFYNARVAVESNVTSFHEWAIRKGFAHYFMHRKEIHILSEMVPNSTINNEIGVRMEGIIKQKALDFGIEYVDQILSTYTEIPRDKEGKIILNEDGKHKEEEPEVKYLYGVTRIKDVMLMEEMLKYSSNGNFDRIISFVLGLMACKSNTNRNFIVDEAAPMHYRKDYKAPDLSPSIKNPRYSNPSLRGHFRKR